MILFFYREGFSYCTDNGDNRPKVFDFKITQEQNWEAEIIKEFDINLGLRRNFNLVKASFLTSFFNLIPTEFSDENPETLLNFSEAEFENNKLLKSETIIGTDILYGVSQVLIDKLNALYPKVETCHSGKIFIDSVSKGNETVIHLNLVHHYLEVMVMENDKLLFYNLFDTPTGEDILFYSLYVMDQLGLDTNSVQMKTYSELTFETKVFQLLKKYVRNINQALKDELFLKNFDLYNLMKCELSQAHSEGKK